MKNIKLVIVFLLTGSLACLISQSYGQTQQDNSGGLVPNDVQKKIHQLSSNDPKQRAKAACALGKMKDRAAPSIPFLISLLSDGAAIDPSLQCKNEFPFEDEEWQPAFEELHESTVGFAATQALIAIYEPAIKPLIQTLVNGADWRARKNAAWALFHRGGVRSDVMEALIEGTKDDDWQVRAQSAYGLGHKGASQIDVVPHLLRSLADSHAWVRETAAMGLWHTANDSAIPAMIAALDDPDPAVRKQLAQSLGNRVDNSSVNLLIAAAADKNTRIRDGARDALKVVNHRAAGNFTHMQRVEMPRQH
jgi:HEAT repeat protein